MATRGHGLIELVQKLDKRKQKIVLDAVEAGVEALKNGISLKEVLDKVRSEVKTHSS